MTYLSDSRKDMLKMWKSDIPYSSIRGRAYKVIPYKSLGNVEGNRKGIPLAQWCKDNFCSRKKALNMLRKGLLLGLSYQGRMYVYDCKNEL